MSRRRSDEEQKALYELWRQSGLGGMEFCKQNNLSSKSLWRWKKKFDETNNSNKLIAKDIKFYPVGEVSNNRKESFLEIMLPKGISCKAYLPERSISNFLQELLK